jgi:hypothetical protein
MLRRRTNAIALTVAAVAAYVLAVLGLDFLRVDTCLDMGGAWDRDAEACLLDGRSIRAAHSLWVYGLFGVASIAVFVAACGSVVAACMRRWAFAQRVAGRSFGAACAILVFAVVLVATAVPDGESPESKATRLAKTISELMNVTAGIYPAIPVSGATWAVATVVLWLRRPRARD